MSHPALVVVRTFLSTIEAEVAQSALDAAGIESMLKADDCGGLRPHMQMSAGVELLVRNDDAQEAARVLDAATAAEGDEDL